MSKWVLVTGSAKRIGRAIAHELAKGGWDIVIHYHNSKTEAQETAKEIKARGRDVHLAEIDFCNKRAVENLIPSLAKSIGPLTALVNNASLYAPDSKAPGGHQHRAVTYEAPRILCEAFRKQLPAGQSGAIVNILDNCPPELGFSAYTLSKKALREMTLELAYRYAPQIRINGVALGPALPGERQSPDSFKRLVKATLMQKEVTPEAVAMTVRFLIDNPAIVGEIVYIDGGIRLKNMSGMVTSRTG